MAFLCPVRIRRNKKRKEGEKEPLPPSMGRITGSASIETLVRVGIEKEHGLSPDSKMVVLHDFTPCVDDELEVKRGNIVNVLYQENEWVYVISETEREGFIPSSYCSPYTSHFTTKQKKLPRGGLDSDPNTTINASIAPSSNMEPAPSQGVPGLEGSEDESYGHGNLKNGQHLPMRDSQTSLQSGGSSQPDCHPFFKDPAGRYIVLYTFIARDENDVSVERGEFVTVLNREDPDWLWVVRSDGQEGFVPSAFVYPADVIQGGVSGMGLNQPGGLPGARDGSGAGHEDIRYHGTELVMLYDYRAQAPDDLSVRRGDWIYADLTNQTVDGWIWSFAPKTRKYGFIPKAYARPPAMTSL